MQPGDVIDAALRYESSGSVAFDDVRLVDDDHVRRVDAPTPAGATARGTALGEAMEAGSGSSRATPRCDTRGAWATGSATREFASTASTASRRQVVRTSHNGGNSNPAMPGVSPRSIPVTGTPVATAVTTGSNAGVYRSADAADPLPPTELRKAGKDHRDWQRKGLT